MSSTRMHVSHWDAPAKHFSWQHVQAAIDQIDAQVYTAAIDAAKGLFVREACSCPACGRPAADLFWVSVSSPPAEWEASKGKVGFLTICEPCQEQVDYLIDQELTEMQAALWRDKQELY